MNNKEATIFIKNYFKELFIKRNLSALDTYLHTDYWDDDIGNPKVNHIENSKEYLSKLFINKPNVGIKVNDVIIKNNVITAYLDWYNDIDNPNDIWMQGIGIFVIQSTKILKRHTYIYNNKE